MYVMNEGFIKPVVDTHLEEMARMDIPDDADGLPFRVVVNSPDPNKVPHAHILALDVKETEMGTFVLTDNPPKKVEDFVEYKVGPHKGLGKTPEEWLGMIIEWAVKPNREVAMEGASVSNWTAMKILYRFSSKKPRRQH